LGEFLSNAEVTLEMLSQPTTAPPTPAKPNNIAAASTSADDPTLALICDLDISVSHADRRFPIPLVRPGESPLLAALIAVDGLGDVSLCTPARRSRGL